jgi:hypothetical protein
MNAPAQGFRAEALALTATLLLPLGLGSMPGGRWLLPLCAPLTLYASFARRARGGDLYAAWKVAMLWAGCLAAGVALFVVLFPDGASRGILHGEDYRQEMFGWIATGEGRENDWRLFVPQHLLHLAVFVTSCWLSGGYLGLVIGAALLDYMAYFVASYAIQSGRPLAGMLLAWVPWSVVRIMAFVLLGVLFARPLLVRRFWPFGWIERRLLLLAL